MSAMSRKWYSQLMMKAGPYWMSPEGREQTRNNQHGTTIIMKEYTKPQLIQLLKRKRGIVSPKGNKQKIQDMA
jgi:molybdate-binding protein